MSALRGRERELFNKRENSAEELSDTCHQHTLKCGKLERKEDNKKTQHKWKGKRPFCHVAAFLLRIFLFGFVDVRNFPNFLFFRAFQMILSFKRERKYEVQ